MADQANEAIPPSGRGGKPGQRGGWNRGGNNSNKSHAPKVVEQTKAADAPTPSGPQAVISTKKPVKAQLPGPTQVKQDNEKINKTTTMEESLFHEAVCGAERDLNPAIKEIGFFPNSMGYIPTVNETYQVYRNERNKQLSKEFAPECLRYYGACLYWLKQSEYGTRVA